MHRWIAIAALAALAAACTPARAAPPPELDPSQDLEAGALDVLDRHCRSCHTGPDSSGGFDVLDFPALLSGGLIQAGDAAGSPLWQRMDAGEMPPEMVGVRPAAAERQAVRAWIDQMSVAGPLRGDAEVEQALAADQAALPPAARPHARWLTLVHLASAIASSFTTSSRAAKAG